MVVFMAMSEVIELENIVTRDCNRVVHLMSNNEIGLDVLESYCIPATIRPVKEMGVWHVRAKRPYKGVMDFCCEGWPRPKRFVLWSLVGCGSVSEALREAAAEFERIFKSRPQYAFIKNLPHGVENAHEFDDLVLFQAEWMTEKSIAVGWL